MQNDFPNPESRIDFGRVERSILYNHWKNILSILLSRLKFFQTLEMDFRRVGSPGLQGEHQFVGRVPEPASAITDRGYTLKPKAYSLTPSSTAGFLLRFFGDNLFGHDFFRGGLLGFCLHRFFGCLFRNLLGCGFIFGYIFWVWAFSWNFFLRSFGGRNCTFNV